MQKTNPNSNKKIDNLTFNYSLHKAQKEAD